MTSFHRSPALEAIDSDKPRNVAEDSSQSKDGELFI